MKAESAIRYFKLDQPSMGSYRIADGAAADSERWLGPCSTLNVLIGPNNSGKSRLLRELFRHGPERAPWTPNHKSLSDLVAVFKGHAPKLQHILLPEGEYLRAVTGKSNAIANCLGELLRFCAGDITLEGTMLYGNPPRAIKILSDAFATIKHDGRKHVELNAAQNTIDSILRDAQSTVQTLRLASSYHRVYIPTLRGLRHYGPDDLYHNRTCDDYFNDLREAGKEKQQLKPPCEIVTGLRLYHDVRSFLLGNYDQREMIRDFQEFLSRHFFDGKRVQVIPRERDLRNATPDVLHIAIGNEAERAIFELGDGLQQIIIMTLPMMLHRDKNLLLFIEEPENYLHPGFQRLLIEALLTEPCTSGSRQVFVATHSHQFLDITLTKSDVSIFALRKDVAPVQERQWTPIVRIFPTSNADRPLLRELGVCNSSVMLTNCTVWVEGPSDRMYISHFLQLLQSHRQSVAAQRKHPAPIALSEDLHWSFVEYGGSNITHWSFLDDEGMDASRLCGELLLIADRDSKDIEWKVERHRQLKLALKDRFIPLECREIENLLSPGTLVKVVRDYEKNDELTCKSFDQSDYVDVPIGRFIEQCILPANYLSIRRSKRGHPYSDPSGTVRGKVDFAERSTSHISTFDDLSTGARNLAIDVDRFIRSHNSGLAIKNATDSVD